jgi:hypothetical protein
LLCWFLRYLCILASYNIDIDLSICCRDSLKEIIRNNSQTIVGVPMVRHSNCLILIEQRLAFNLRVLFSTMFWNFHSRWRIVGNERRNTGERNERHSRLAAPTFESASFTENLIANIYPELSIIYVNSIRNICRSFNSRISYFH